MGGGGISFSLKNISSCYYFFVIFKIGFYSFLIGKFLKTETNYFLQKMGPFPVSPYVR